VNVSIEERLAVNWFYHQIAPPKRSAVFMVKAAFTLRPGKDAEWADEPACLSSDLFVGDDPNQSLRYASDFAPHKPRADWCLVGAAHAYQGKPAPQVNVNARIGKQSKSLIVFGNRAWSSNLLSGTRKSEPEPFVKMPLIYENAFGGPGYKKNPIGTGRKSERMPNVESYGKLLAGPNDNADPAGFGPLAASWEPRSLLVGSYKGDWVKKRWPWFPEDFDWAYFNAAPPDQQISGYFRGDEELEFQNLHPQHAIYRSRLPGLRARCFVSEKADRSTKRYREVPLQLDTVWIDMDAEKLILVWRGQTEVKSAKLKEIDDLLVCTEPLTEPIRKLSDDPELIRYRLGEPARREAQREATAAAARAKAFADMEVQAASLEKEAAAIEASAAKIDLESQARFAAAGIDLPSASAAISPAEQVQAMRGAAEQSLARLAESHPDLAHPLPGDALGEFESLLKEETRPPQPPAREELQAAVAEQISFAEQDLSGLDLSGLDLRKANFNQAILKNANLQKANLTAADLRGADLTGANLTGADLSGAILDGADLTQAALSQARLAGSSWKAATISGIDLTNADFSGCNCAKADFTGSKLSQAKFVGSDLTQANFCGCELQKSDFRQACLRATQFEGVKAREINMEEAEVGGIHAAGQGDFTGGNFKKVRGVRSIWENGIFDQADFSKSLLNGAQFSGASLRKTNFDRAHLISAAFDDASLPMTRLTNANLLRASFAGAELTETDFEGSNLFEAGFFEAAWQRLNLRNANVKSTLLR
jgi:uncharacterized protein YjbI with pentapeptide repeats